MKKVRKIIALLIVLVMCISVVPVSKVEALTQQEQEDIYRVDFFTQYRAHLDMLMNSDYFVYHNVTVEQEFIYNVVSWDNKEETQTLVASLLEMSEEGIKEKNKAEIYGGLLTKFFGSYKDFINVSNMPISKVTMIENAIKEVSSYYLTSQNINITIKTNSGDIDYPQILKQVLDRCEGLTASEQAGLKADYDWFVQSSTWMKDVQSISKIVSSTTKILDVAQKSLSMFVELESYKTTNDQILVLLQDIADNTGNRNLKNACLDMKKKLTQTYEENLVDEVERIVSEELFNYALDSVKDKIWEKFGFTGVMAKIGITLGKEVANAWFNTDDQVALMKSIWCIDQITEVLVSLLEEKVDQYRQYTSKTSYKAEKASLIIFYVRVLQTLREKGERCYYDLQMSARSSVAVRDLAIIDIFDLTGIKKGTEQVKAWYDAICRCLADTRHVLLGDIEPARYLPYVEEIEKPVYERLATDFTNTIPDGIYTFKNCRSGNMLNVYNGNNTDGTSVVTWEFDATTDQRFYVKHISHGQYVLYAVSSVTASGDYTRCLDVYTGGVSAVPSEGDKVDIWTRSNSWNKSQLFYIVEAENGGYILESCASPSMVVGADNPYKNGGSVSIQKYTGNNEQCWELCDTTGSENLDQIYENTHINTGDRIEDLIAVATTQCGYKELDAATGIPLYNGQGTWYTKYGERFNHPSGAWCAYFVMWCAEQADIPASVIPQSRPYGNCGTFVNWFKANERWADPYRIVNGEIDYYIPQKGDIVFLDRDGDGDADHVGIAVGYTADGTVYTIEGNVPGDSNGNTSVSEGYFQVVTTLRAESEVLGYGVPDYFKDIYPVDINATVTAGGTSMGKAYALPSTTANTVWYVDKGDRCQVLCEDGDFYLLMYPFLNTGKYVAAYVPKTIVNVPGNVATADTYYSINKEVVLSKIVKLYHNASTDSLVGSSGLDNRIRGTLRSSETVTVLFEMEDFYFIRTDGISGFAQKADIDLNNIPGQEEIPTDPEQPTPPEEDDSEKDYLPGDVDGNGKLDENDGQMILQYCVKLIDFSANEKKRADADGNGKIDPADASKVFVMLKEKGE